MNAEEVRRLVAESRAAQGLPPHVEDPGMLARIAALVLGKPLPPLPPAGADEVRLAKLAEEIRRDRDELKALRDTATERLIDHAELARRIYELEKENERLRAIIDGQPTAPDDG